MISPYRRPGSKLLKLINIEIVDPLLRFGWMVHPEGKRSYKELCNLYLGIPNPFRFLRDPLVRSKTFLSKYLEETSHYTMLEKSLFHKREEIRYFFRERPDETRKWVVFSPLECISLIQILLRKEMTYLIVYMRSSDVVNLLPVDIIGLIRIFSLILGPTKKKRKTFLEIIIGSAHIYSEDL